MKLEVMLMDLVLFHESTNNIIITKAVLVKQQDTTYNTIVEDIEQ